MSDKQEAPKLVEVALAKPHTHRGVPYDANATIKVTEPEAAWLRKAGVIADAAKEAKTK